MSVVCVFVVLLCRGLAWLSCWLESHTPAAHLIISSTHTLLSAGLFRLFGVVHGLSDSSVSCDSGLLCQCVCYLANIQVPASPHLCTLPTLHCGSLVLLPPEPSSIPQPMPVWVAATTLSHLLYHLPELQPEPLLLPPSIENKFL